MTPFGIGRDTNEGDEHQPGAPAPPPDEGVSNVQPVSGGQAGEPDGPNRPRQP